MKNKIKLWGEWNFSFSPMMEGDTIQLPSTTEICKKGSAVPDENQVMHLSRIYPFIILYLERTKYTEILVDGKPASGSHETLVPQEHDLTRMLSPGKHTITIIVDNDLEEKEDFSESLMRSHQYTDHTQMNWNGILCSTLSACIRRYLLGYCNISDIVPYSSS